MSSFIKRGKYWYFKFRGRRVSTGCTGRTAAEAAARDIERRVVDPTYRAAHETTLGAALIAYVADQKAKGLAEGTVEMGDLHARHLARVMGEHTPLASIDARVIDDYVSTRTDEGASQSTRCKEVLSLRGALLLARRRREYPHALEEVLPKLSPGYVPLERRLSEEQLAQLVAHLPAPRAAVCAFIAATAADWASVELAQPSDFDLKRNRVFVRGTKNEHRRREVAVVLPLFRRLLKLAAPHAPFTRWPNAVRDLAVACRQLGIPRVTPRDLRRTHGYILRAHGVEPHLIARSMGHATSTMVERVYGKLPTDAFESLLVARLGPTRVQRKASKRSTSKKKAGSRG